MDSPLKAHLDHLIETAATNPRMSRSQHERWLAGRKIVKAQFGSNHPHRLELDPAAGAMAGPCRVARGGQSCAAGIRGAPFSPARARPLVTPVAPVLPAQSMARHAQ